MAIQLPIHIHDCDGCRFLGSFDGKDVWSCDDIDLIIRVGPSEEENCALPITLVETICKGLRSSDAVADWKRALALYEWRQFPSYWRDLKHRMEKVDG